MLRTSFNLSGITRIKMNSRIIALVLIVCLASFVSGKSIFVQCNILNNDKKLLNGIHTKAGNRAFARNSIRRKTTLFRILKKILLFYFYHRNVLFCMRYSHNNTIALLWGCNLIELMEKFI